jgi:hypothetical protein
MTTDWLANSSFGRFFWIFGTAVDSNFGWSSLGKPADDGDSAPAGVAEGAPLLPVRTRSGRAVLKDPQDRLLLSGPCGIRCGAHLRKARSVLLQPLLLAWPWRGPLLAATLWQQGLGAGLPAPRGPPGRSSRCVWPV